MDVDSTDPYATQPEASPASPSNAPTYPSPAYQAPAYPAPAYTPSTYQEPKDQAPKTPSTPSPAYAAEGAYPPPSKLGASTYGGASPSADAYADGRAKHATDGIERAAAAVSGALEGAAQAIEHHRVREAAHAAIDKVDHVWRSVRGGKGQPAMSATAAPYVDATHPAGTGPEVTQFTGHPLRPSGPARVLHEATDRAADAVETARTDVADTVEDVRYKAHAVRESSQRAARAPKPILRDLGMAFTAWRKGAMTSLGLVAAAGAIGIAGFAVLTVALSIVFDNAFGSPGGMFLLVALYALAAVALVGAGRAAQARGRAKAREQLGAARATARDVAAPVREAFGPARRERRRMMRQARHAPRPHHADRAPSYSFDATAPRY